jgi:hypothetical protein
VTCAIHVSFWTTGPLLARAPLLLTALTRATSLNDIALCLSAGAGNETLVAIVNSGRRERERAEFMHILTSIMS